MSYSGSSTPLWIPRLWLALVLLSLAACGPPLPPTPPMPTYPSRVVTQDGLAFWVKDLRLPGTRQELRVREGGSTQWLHLSTIQAIYFSGATVDQYRHGEVVLLTGEKLQGEIYVGTLIQGKTELGYWNVQLEKVDRLDLGTE